MRTRVISGLVSIAMLTFGQWCALGCFMAHDRPEVVATADAGHATACDPSECGGQAKDDGQSGCASGATTCCSAWGPPIERLSVPPSTRSSLGMADAGQAIDDHSIAAKRASEVALFELAGLPAHPAEALLAASLSRRGPPALA